MQGVRLREFGSAVCSRGTPVKLEVFCIALASFLTV